MPDLALVSQPVKAGPGKGSKGVGRPLVVHLAGNGFSQDVKSWGEATAMARVLLTKHLAATVSLSLVVKP